MWPSVLSNIAIDRRPCVFFSLSVEEQYDPGLDEDQERNRFLSPAGSGGEMLGKEERL